MDNTTIYNNVKLGKDVIIEPFCIIGLPSGLSTKNKDDNNNNNNNNNENSTNNNEDSKITIIGDNSHIRSHTVIYSGNNIGKNFNTGHHVVIRENNIIGNDCSIGSHSELGFNTTIGNNVKIHSDCHIFEDSILEDDVRFNPGVYVLNTKYPYRPGEKPIITPVIIRKGAIIAARATLMPGIEIGKHALIGAGSLVTKNVNDYALVYGHPAIVKGDVRELLDSSGNARYKL